MIVDEFQPYVMEDAVVQLLDLPLAYALDNYLEFIFLVVKLYTDAEVYRVFLYVDLLILLFRSP